MMRSVKLSIRISATPSRVYRAVTDFRELEKWLVPKTADSQSSDTIIFEWPHHRFPVQTLSRSQDRSITWSWYNEQGVGDKVTWTFDADSDGTIVRLEHSGFSEESKDLEMYCNHIEGWTAYLCNLRCFVEWNRDLRSSQHKGSVAM